jgi:uridine kinase
LTGQVRVIAIVGGSGVGKSSLAQTLAERLRPRTVAMLCEDDYYREFSHLPDFDPAQCNFDEPGAKDHPRLVQDLRRLCGGQGIVRPAYAFATHSRRPRGVRVPPAEVVILEGQHLLCDAELRALIHLAVYLDVDADLRFIRRLRRDMVHRRRGVKSIVHQYLRHVRPSHDLYVEPSRAHADLVLRESPDVAGMSSQHQAWSDLIIGALLDREGERRCTG